MYGYGGKILYIDLSSGKVTRRELGDEFARKYIGGNGFGARLLYDNTRPGIDALGAENCLILAPGSFCGSPVPEASKTGFYAKSPITGAFGESMFGAAIGPELKFAGYDALLITGRASRWSYLWINDDNVEIKNATSMIGQTTLEVADEIRKDLGEREAIVASIGPAGENQVKFADIECEYREAGRTGMGAVMGSKRLKAIAVQGSEGLELADPKLMEELVSRWYDRIISHPSAIADMKYGTAEDLSPINEVHGVFPTRNWQDSVFEGHEELAPQNWVPKYSIRNEACFGCIKPCGKVFVINEGKYAGTIVDGPEYETLFSLGSLVGNSDIEALAKANKLCDDLGMDTISAGAAVAWAMECYERGLLSRQDVNGLDLRFGNAEAMLKLLQMIANREGIGDILAEGTREASRRLGRGSEFAIHVKGLEPAAYDMRGMKGYALACAVSTRGACHLRACAYSPELSGSWWRFRKIERLSTKNKEYVKILEDVMTLYDMTGICKFTRHLFFVEELIDFFKAVHGYEPDVRELIEAGERVYNLEKVFNIREGFARRDDTLPPRVMKEPIRDGPSRGQLINREDLDYMLDDYYRIRGWDSNGIPTRQKLEELELSDIADDLGTR